MWLFGLTAGGLGSAYALAGAGLYAGQRQILFPAPTLDREVLDAAAEQTGATPIELLADDGTRLYGWHRATGSDKAVLFFHGNAETLLDRVPLHDFCVEQGFDFLIIAYRGYPGSDGTPSEDGLTMDAMAAWNYLVEHVGIDPARIVVHGKSMGGGVSAALSEQVQPTALVLESTYLSLPEVAADKAPVFPVRTMLRDRFDTRSRAPRIQSRVLILHGDADWTINVRHGRELHAAFEGSTYLELAGAGHGETLVLAESEARAAYREVLASIPDAP